MSDNSDKEVEFAKICNIFMGFELFEDEVQMWSYADEHKRFRCAYTKAIDDEQVHLIFNLPQYTNKLFIAMSDGEPENIARYIAHLEEVCIDKNITKTHVIRFSDSYMDQNGVVGVILLNHAVNPLLKNIDTQISQQKIDYEPILVVFISQDEYEVWQENDRNHLMNYFERKNKDTILFCQNN